MTEKAASWDMSDMVVLIPFGEDHAMTDVDLDVQFMNGDVVYAGQDLARATHEFVPEGAIATTDLPQFTADDLKARLNLARVDFASFLAPHARKAYVPRVSKEVGSETESHYFGRPWLPDDLDWPSQDGRPMNFVLQLNLATLPGDWAPRGETEAKELRNLLLFFRDEESSGDENHIIVVSLDRPGKVCETPAGAYENPTLTIVDWKAVEDHPSIDDLQKIDGCERFETGYESLVSCTVGVVTDLKGQDHTEKDAIELGVKSPHHSYECDKLGGWPCWKQRDETLTDREGARMGYFMQIGCEGLILGDIDPEEINWPTWGRGHIFASLNHVEFKYVWAFD